MELMTDESDPDFVIGRGLLAVDLVDDTFASVQHGAFESSKVPNLVVGWSTPSAAQMWKSAYSYLVCTLAYCGKRQLEYKTIFGVCPNLRLNCHFRARRHVQRSSWDCDASMCFAGNHVMHDSNLLLKEDFGRKCGYGQRLYQSWSASRLSGIRCRKDMPSYLIGHSTTTRNPTLTKKGVLLATRSAIDCQGHFSLALWTTTHKKALMVRLLISAHQKDFGSSYLCYQFRCLRSISDIVRL